MEFRDGEEIRQTILRLLAELRLAINGCPPITDFNPWRMNTLLSFGAEIIINCVELVAGENEGNLSRGAWAGRNLLELHYWTRYFLQSEENARRFHEDAICDLKDYLEKLGHLAPPDVLATGKEQVAGLVLRMEQIRESDKFLSIARVAKSLGEETTYSEVNKFFSKFVHPTSMSIQLRLFPEAREKLAPVILHSAVIIIEATLPLVVEALHQYHKPENAVQAH